jgi:hypothetical protein
LFNIIKIENPTNKSLPNPRTYIVPVLSIGIYNLGMPPRYLPKVSPTLNTVTTNKSNQAASVTNFNYVAQVTPGNTMKVTHIPKNSPNNIGKAFLKG